MRCWKLIAFQKVQQAQHKINLLLMRIQNSKSQVKAIPSIAINQNFTKQKKPDEQEQKFKMSNSSSLINENIN